MLWQGNGELLTCTLMDTCPFENLFCVFMLFMCGVRVIVHILKLHSLLLLVVCIIISCSLCVLSLLFCPMSAFEKYKKISAI